MKENGTSNPQPLFIAGGAGSAAYSIERDFSKASLSLAASGNDKLNKVGSSGVQKFIRGDIDDFYCAGAGFLEEPKTGRLRKNSVAPKSYKEGLIGGKGIDKYGNLTEGGFGGGGALNDKNGHRYFGAGGGYTGGGIFLDGSSWCYGGGGGSFSIDEEAKFDHVHEEYGKCTVTYLDYK